MPASLGKSAASWTGVSVQAIREEARRLLSLYPSTERPIKEMVRQVKQMWDVGLANKCVDMPNLSAGAVGVGSCRGPYLW